MSAVCTFPDFKQVKVKGVVSDSLWPHELYLPGSSAHGIFQNTGVGSCSLLQRSSQPRDWTQISHIAGGFITIWATMEAWFQTILCYIYVCVHAQLCPTLWSPTDCSLPGTSVHRIFQAKILEWVVISFSKGSFWPKDWTCISCVSCIGGQIL